MTVSVVQEPVCSDPGGGLSFWRRALRAGITFIILPSLGARHRLHVCEDRRPKRPMGPAKRAIARHGAVILPVRAYEFHRRRCRAHDLPDAARCGRVSASSQKCGDRQRGRALLFPRRDRFPVDRARRLALLSRRPAGREHDHAAARPLDTAEEGRQPRAQAGRGGLGHQDLCASVANGNPHPLHECRAARAQHVRIRRSGALLFRRRRSGADACPRRRSWSACCPSRTIEIL